ncbi:MAG: BMP family protein [Myxococcaceae bacterium]
MSPLPRWLSAAAALSLCLVSACRREAASQAPATTLVVGLVTDTAGRGDQSFNDSALRGLEQWAAGNATSVEKSVPPEWKTEDIVVRPLGVRPRVLLSKAPEDYEPNLQLLADQGASLVVATGFLLENAVEAVAKRNPGTRFLLIDSALLDGQGNAFTLPNVRAITFREEEGSFLAGALAAWVSRSGKVGFIGGMDIALIRRFEAGFRAGVAHARPGAERQLVANYTGSFDNAAAGKQLAQDMLARGIDVLFHAAGADGLGVIQAVKEARAQGSGAFVIGVDSDQAHLAPDAVLSSMVKRIDWVVYQAVQSLAENRFASGTVGLGLKERAVGLAPIRVSFPEKANVVTRLSELETAIVNGKLVIPAVPLRRPSGVP